MERAGSAPSASSAAHDAKITKFFVRNELALHVAAKKGDDSEVERLLAFGRSDVNEIDRHGQSALHIAAFEGHLAVVDVLIKKGIAISSLDKNSWSPLHAAAKEGHMLICERLLLEGADPNVASSSGTTPFLYLVAHPCSDLLLFIMHLMLKRGADPNAANEHGLTALHNACLRAGEGNVLFLLLNGASVDPADKFGETPLHVACRTGKKRVAQLLINFGATLSSKGPDGTPEETARKYGFTEVAEFIAQLRRDPSKALGKKKSSKSMKKKLVSSGRNSVGNEDEALLGDSSRGSGTESTGTETEDALAAATPKSKSAIEITSKDVVRKLKKHGRTSSREQAPAPTPDAGLPPKPEKSIRSHHAPRRVASAIHSIPPAAQEAPAPSRGRTKRSSSGGAIPEVSETKIEEPKVIEEPAKTLETLIEQSTESTVPSPSITPSPSANDLSSVTTDVKSDDHSVVQAAEVQPTETQQETQPTAQSDCPPPAVISNPTSPRGDDPTDFAYSDIASPRETKSAPSTAAVMHRDVPKPTSPRQAVSDELKEEEGDEVIPFGPRRIQQHSTGVRQQKAAAAVAAVQAATADRARRGRSIKIESLLKFFESSGGDVRGGTLPTKVANSPGASPNVASKVQRTDPSSAQNGDLSPVSPRKDPVPARNPPSRNTSGGPSDHSLVQAPVRKDSGERLSDLQSSPVMSRLMGDSRRATVGDVGQIRQMFASQGLNFDSVMQQHQSPRALAMSGAGSSEDESRKKNSTVASVVEPQEENLRTVGPGVPPLTVDSRASEPLSGSSSPRTPAGSRHSPVKRPSAADATATDLTKQLSSSSSDSDSDSEEDDVSAVESNTEEEPAIRTKGSLSGSKDDSAIPTMIRTGPVADKPNPLKKGGSKDTMLSVGKTRLTPGSRPTRVDSGRLYGFKQLQPTVIGQVTAGNLGSGAPKPPDSARSLPFSTHISKFNFEALLSIPEMPAPTTHKQHKDDLIVPNSDFSAECGRSSSDNRSPSAGILFAEDTEFTTPHYWDNFFTKDEAANPDDIAESAKLAVPHFNFVGYLELAFYPAGEPVIISCVQRGDIILGLCRTRSGDNTFHVEWPSDKKAKHKSVLKLLLDNNPQLKDAKLVRSKDPQIISELLSYERIEKNQFKRISEHKIGILFIKEGQTTEEAVLSNRSGSDRFESFLTFLGKKIDLQGYEGFDGGLDTKKDRCGKHSIMARWLEFEIMFHVSTYIPLGSGEEKLIARKKYIGNDMTCLVFLDTSSTKFEPPLISGDFLHNFIVVKPSAEDPDSFTVNVATRLGVPQFGPALPKHGSFKRGEQFHDWLLSKLVNAERATLNSTQFISKLRLARQKLLSGMVESFRKEK